VQRKTLFTRAKNDCCALHVSAILGVSGLKLPLEVCHAYNGSTFYVNSQNQKGCVRRHNSGIADCCAKKCGTPERWSHAAGLTVTLVEAAQRRDARS
jgi:hypothetical protein